METIYGIEIKSHCYVRHLPTGEVRDYINVKWPRKGVWEPKGKVFAKATKEEFEAYWAGRKAAAQA